MQLSVLLLFSSSLVQGMFHPEILESISEEHEDPEFWNHLRTMDHVGQPQIISNMDMIEKREGSGTLSKSFKLGPRVKHPALKSKAKILELSISEEHEDPEFWNHLRTKDHVGQAQIISNMDMIEKREGSGTLSKSFKSPDVPNILEKPKTLPQCHLFNFVTHPLAKLSSWSINTWYQKAPSCVISTITKLLMVHTLNNPYVWMPEEIYGAKARYDFQLVQVQGLEHLRLESLKVLSPTQVEVNVTTAKLDIELVVERSNDFSGTLLSQFWSRWIGLVNLSLEFVSGYPEFFPQDVLDEDEDGFIVTSKNRILVSVESSEASLNLEVSALESLPELRVGWEALKLVCLKKGNIDMVLKKFVNVSVNRMDVSFDPNFDFKIFQLINPDDRIGNVFEDLINVGAKQCQYYARHDPTYLGQLQTFVSDGMKDVLNGLIKAVCGPRFYKGCIVPTTGERDQ